MIITKYLLYFLTCFTHILHNAPFLCLFALIYDNIYAVVELDRGSIFRYPCNYGKYLELKAARLAAEDAETERARTKLRRESEWMARQPKARQAKSRARENAFYELVDKAKGRSPDSKALELATPEEKAKQKRLGGVVAKFRNAGTNLSL